MQTLSPHFAASDGSRPSASDGSRRPASRPECAVLDASATVRTLAKSLTVTLRRLRRSLADCPACDSYEDCQVLDQINAIITNAIQSVQDEWSIDSTRFPSAHSA